MNKASLPIFIAVVMLLVGLPGKSQSVRQLLSDVQTKLLQVADYEASGVMKTNVSFLKVPVSKIKLYFKKPDLLKIRSEKGVSFVPRGAVALNMSGLLQQGKFDVLDAGKGKHQGKEVQIVKLIPSDEEGAVLISILYIDPLEKLVMKARTTTRESGTYDMEFSYGKYSNYALPDRISFSFDAREYKLPKGITFDFDDGKGKKISEKAEGKKKGNALIIVDRYIINKGLDASVFK
jgi:hypothetical protein